MTNPMTNTMRWTFSLCFMLIVVGRVCICEVGDNAIAEKEVEPRRISMRFKDASVDHVLEFLRVFTQR